MNKRRRAAIEDIRTRLEGLKEELEFLQEEEQEAFDNLPESLQGGERGQQMDDYISKLGDAASDMENAIDNLDLEN